MTKANENIREAFEREFERERKYKPDFNEDVQQYCLSSIQASYSDFASGYQAAHKRYAMDKGLVEEVLTVLRDPNASTSWKARIAGYVDFYRDKVGE